MPSFWSSSVPAAAGLTETGSNAWRPRRNAKSRCARGGWSWRSLLLVALVPGGSVLASTFSNPFGLQLRPPPTSMAGVRAPVILRAAPTNEMALVRRSDGTLELYGIAKPASDAVTVARSRDGGLTWSEPEPAFALPGKAYYAIQVLEAADGALHAVVHIQGEGPGGYRGRLYEVHHFRRSPAALGWSEPRRVVPGYVGSIRGFRQLRSGRIVLAVARAVPAREKPPAGGPDLGWNDTFVYFTDDGGTMWRQSPDVLSLELAGPNVTRYGAIEPVLLELKDRVWMLGRDRGGRLWESYSADGERWSAAARTAFISSDSPAGLLRLRDGGIVLFVNGCQNGSDPRSYAMGGREVLHAAISRDEGATWRGFREVLQEPIGAGRVERGDRGTAYPSAVENDAGRVILVSGQGEGKRAIVAFDPRWLEETDVRDDLRLGPVGWTQYGAAGMQLERLAAGSAAVALPPGAPGIGGALWNFPIAAAGEIALRWQVPAGAQGLRLVLTDHFNRIDDFTAAEHAVFVVDGEKLGRGSTDGLHDVTLRWTDAAGKGVLHVAIDGRELGTHAARRPAQFGVNYLRIELRDSTDRRPLLVAQVAARARR